MRYTRPMIWLVLVGWTAVAATTDWLSVLWQECREQRRPWAAAGLGAVLESLTWAPLVLVIATEQWTVVGACVVGSALGSGLGVARARRK